MWVARGTHGGIVSDNETTNIAGRKGTGTSRSLFRANLTRGLPDAKARNKRTTLETRTQGQGKCMSAEGVEGGGTGRGPNLALAHRPQGLDCIRDHVHRTPRIRVLCVGFLCLSRSLQACALRSDMLEKRRYDIKKEPLSQSTFCKSQNFCF